MNVLLFLIGILIKVYKEEKDVISAVMDFLISFLLLTTVQTKYLSVDNY